MPKNASKLKGAVLPLFVCVLAMVLAMSGFHSVALAEVTGDVEPESILLGAEEETTLGSGTSQADGDDATDLADGVEADSTASIELDESSPDVAKGESLETVGDEEISVVGQSDDEAVALDAQAESAHVAYGTHVQSIGWQAPVRDGAVSGTIGWAKRLEGISLRLEGVPGSILYRTHVQSYGWQAWRSDGQMSGTSGQSKRLEAIEIKLSGPISSRYDVWYRVHAQSFGWMGWAKNGERAGTATMGKRLEAIQVLLQPKGSYPPPNNYRGISRSYAAAYATRQVQYRTHVQSYGWQGWSFDGASSGTSGQSKRLEGIEIRLADPLYSGSIQYRTHVQTYGWQGWVSNGAMSGTSGQAKRLEAIQIRLTGEIANKYDVWYRVHAQTFGWMGWAKNGASAGTEGWSKRLEAIEIRLTRKGAAAPGSTANAFRRATRISASYETLYGPVLREWQSNARRTTDGITTRVQYFIHDINRDGIAELIVGDKGVGGSEGNVYTVVRNGSRFSVVNLGRIGTGFRDSYRVNSGGFYHSHQYAGGLYVDYLVTISGQRLNERQIGGVTQGRPGVSGTLLYGYNVYTCRSGEYKPSIDYSALRSAGSATFLV